MSSDTESTKVFGYVRVSTTGQVKEEIIKFCQDNDYELLIPCQKR